MEIMIRDFANNELANIFFICEYCARMLFWFSSKLEFLLNRYALILFLYFKIRH